MQDKIDKVTCPTCGKNGTWTPSNTFRPFCSERCKLIDLGEWASETHRIPDESSDIPTEDDSEQEDPS